jgi:hypothetical protein
MVPQFKPVAALVIIAGVSLGPETGFIVGVLTAFVSNFIFGQGPWTPWQAFAFGLIGFLAGLCLSSLAQWLGRLELTDQVRDGRPGRLARRRGEGWCVVKLCLFGAVSVQFLYGGLLDIAAWVMFSAEISPAALLAVMIAGAPFNALQAFATVIFLGLLARPMIEKLERVKQKYGLLAGRSGDQVSQTGQAAGASRAAEASQAVGISRDV